MLTEKAYDATIRLGVVDHHRRRRGRGHRDRRRPSDLQPRPVARGARRAVRRRHRPGADRGLRDQGRRQAGLPAGPRRRGGRAQGPAGDDPRAGGARPARRRRAGSTSTSRCAARAAPTSAPSPATSAPRSGVGGHLTALRRTAVGPFDLVRRPHPRASWPTTSRCCRSPTPPARASPSRRPRRGRRPATCGSVVRSTSPSPGTARTRCSRPTGEFLALYEPRGQQGRPVAVFVG